MINQDETNKVYSPLWHQIYAIVRAGGDYYAIASEIEELLTPISPSPQWIKTSDKLPPDGWYLTFDGKSVDKMLFKYNRWVCQTGRYDDNRVFTRDDMTQYITHWMPIPDFALSLNLPVHEVTDEEINQYVKENGAEVKSIISEACDAGFRSGAKWMRDLLTNKK